MFRNPLEERGGGGLQRAQYIFFKKKPSLCALRAHNVRTHYARTLVVHRVHQRSGQNQSGPKRGRICYITPAKPKQKGTKSELAA